MPLHRLFSWPLMQPVYTLPDPSLAFNTQLRWHLFQGAPLCIPTKSCPSCRALSSCIGMACLPVYLSYSTVSTLRVENIRCPLWHPWCPALHLTYYQTFHKCRLDSGSQWERKEVIKPVINAIMEIWHERVNGEDSNTISNNRVVMDLTTPLKLFHTRYLIWSS